MKRLRNNRFQRIPPADYSLEIPDCSPRLPDCNLKALNYSLKPLDYSQEVIDYRLKALDYSLKPLDYSREMVDYSRKVIHYSSAWADLNKNKTAFMAHSDWVPTREQDLVDLAQKWAAVLGKINAFLTARNATEIDAG